MAVHEIILLNQNTPVNIPSGLVPKGAYDAGTDYAVGDSVNYLGSSYVMFVDAAAGTLPTDTTKWQVLANKGATGGTGTLADLGGVAAPATNTDSYIPQWNGANSKTLKDGLAVPAGGLAGLTALGDKVDKVAGYALSKNDYTDAAVSKLSGIEANANNYSLPTAAAATLGGVKVGDRLSIAAGVLSADVQTTDITGKANLALDNLASVAMNASLQFDNTAARTFDIAPTANTVVGRALTLSAGSTVTGGTADMAGGNLTLNSGLGKGTGASSIIFQTGRTLTTGSTLQTLTEAMRILGNGNIGIGTTNPGSKLDVFLASSGTIQRWGDTTNAYNGYLYYSQVGDGYMRINSGGNTYTPFYLGTSTDAYTLTLTNGNVGIGTTAPTAVLHLKAGVAGAGGACMKLTAGVVLTTPADGAIEWDGTNLYITQTGGTRKTIAFV